MTKRTLDGLSWPLDLLDWKRHVVAMYADAREGGGGEQTLTRFRDAKNDLFAGHVQSPIPVADRGSFSGLNYYPYRSDLRIAAAMEPEISGVDLLLPSSGEEPFRFRRVGRVRFETGGAEVSLAVFWLSSYGGGVFIPFRDATAGRETYGAGRYLLDTVKGSDLGTDADGRLNLDFNYAYNPSCTYDPQWHCPLAPPESRIAVAIEAGERAPYV